MTFVSMEMFKWKNRQWISSKGSQPGVVKLKSGLAYKVLKKRFVGDMPTESSTCKCHYIGSLIDGTIFDSSYERDEPVSFKPSQVIQGWREALLLMKEGEKWELYIPHELAYGKKGQDQIIPPFASLHFIMEILEITGEKKMRDYSAAGMAKERLEQEEKNKPPTVVTMRYNPGNDSNKKSGQEPAKELGPEDYLKDPEFIKQQAARYSKHF